jgi:hypothetical protein
LARRLQNLVEAGEVLRRSFHYHGRSKPAVVYLLDPSAANDPGRVRRVREAIKRHGEEIRAAIQAMDQAQTAQDELPILSA